MTITTLNAESASWPRRAIGGAMRCAEIRFSFSGAETYTTGGISVTTPARNTLGTERMIHFVPSDNGSDAGIASGECTARLDTINQKLKLMTIGIAAGTPGTALADGTEVANGVTINALIIDGLAFFQ